MKKQVAIPALLFGAVAAGGLLYLMHVNTFETAAATTLQPSLQREGFPAVSS